MAEKTGNQGDSSLKGAEKLRHILLEIEESDGSMRPFSGSVIYSGFFRAVYRGRVQMGFEEKNKNTV
jgi:hypothetical protein